MPKSLKVLLWVLAAAAGLLAIGGAIVASRFDANSLKPLLVERVQHDYQRTLAIPGETRLSLFPRIGVTLGAVSLSAHASPEPFASLRSARVSIALLPLLLRRELVVDRVELDGLRATVVRYPDGRTSIDDLLGAPSPASPGQAPASAAAPLPFDVAGLSITDAAVTVDDRTSGRRMALTKVELETGRLAPGRASETRFTGHLQANPPQVDADLSLKADLMLDPAQRRYAFGKLRAELNGRLATLNDAKIALGGDAELALQPLALQLNGVTLALQGQAAQRRLDASVDLPQLEFGGGRITARAIVAKASLEQGPRKLQARFALPAFSGAGRAIRLPAVDAEASVDDGALHAQARLSGAVDADLDGLRFSSPQARLVLGGQQGSTEIKGTLASPWTADLKAQTLTLPRIAAEATLPNPKGGTLALATQGSASVDLARHALDARLAGKLDESRFDARFGMSRFAPAAVSFDLGIDRIDLDRYRAAAAPEKAGATTETPLDLSALRDLDAKGSLRVGALQVAGVKLSQLRVDLRAAGGRIELDPLAAELYQGRVAGSVALVAARQPRVTVRQKLSNVAVGPLLKDAFGQDRLEGRGNVALDVSTQGGSVAALLKALAGSARIELRDGSVRGFNIAQAIRSAKARLGATAGEHAGTGSAAETTDFSELSGSFAIAGGVAHNDDLLAKSPLLRITGNGDVDLGAGRIDYLVKATVVDTLQGQGGPELQSLRGQTVPVRLSGPFSAIAYRVDFAGMVQEMAKKKLDTKAEDLKAKAQQQLGDKLKGLFGK